VTSSNGTTTHADLSTVLAVFQHWLYLPDTDPVVVVLATAAANRLPGDPAWLQLVGPPGGGKTEIVQSIGGLPEVRDAAVITEASLLSGVPKKERESGAKGGLLRELGAYGILVLKDFGSVLSMHRDQRAQLLAALREIYDGSWTRHVGSSGGMTLNWSGKVGMIAGVTPVLDQHHGVMAALGERFCLYRMTVTDADEQARGSLSHFQSETSMRSDLRGAVNALFEGIDTSTAPDLSEQDKDLLIALSTFVARSRSGVIRDGYSREIDMIPESEAPGRLVGVLARMLTGARLIGADSDTAWRITLKAALDSMPAQRLSAIRLLEHRDSAVDTTSIATALGLPTTTARRTLEDLAAHHVLIRSAGGKGNADTWTLSEWTRCRLPRLTVPEMSNTPISHKHVEEDISGTPPSERMVTPDPTVPDFSIREHLNPDTDDLPF
jgi:hypothetical protein